MIPLSRASHSPSLDAWMSARDSPCSGRKTGGRDVLGVGGVRAGWTVLRGGGSSCSVEVGAVLRGGGVEVDRGACGGVGVSRACC